MNEMLRQWAGGICAGCMLAGTVQVLLPSSRHTAVIKNIAVLYIVLAILSPAKSDVTLYAFTEENGLEPRVLLNTAMLEKERTESVLADSFTENLAACGVQAQVRVRIATDEKGVTALDVQAYTPTDAQSRAAQLLLQEWVGEGGVVECQTQANG